MPALWSTKSKNFKPEIIIEQILKSATLTQDGRASYGAEYFEYKSALKSMLEFSRCESLSPDTLDSLIDSALDTYTKEALTSKQKNKEKLLKILNSNIVSHFKKPTKIFHIATSISISGHPPIKRIKIHDAEIRFYPSGLPKKYNTRQQLDETWTKPHAHTPENFSGVIISLEARTLADAFYSSMEHLDFLRGVLSFYANPGMSFSLWGRRKGAINKIRLGGMHTVHNTDGSLASEDYWYEHTEISDKTFVFKQENLKKTAAAIRKILRRIDSITGGERIRDGIIRYTRALDEADSDYSIIKLWGALESTVNESDNSDIIIRRCSYLYKDHELIRQILEISKVYRNRNVHAGISSAAADQIAYQIHRIFRALIFFYVGNKDFRSLREANTFLDSPILDGDINRKIYLLKKAVRFRNGD